ncbi:hypothetical protein HGG75_22395 [Ochrobactrum pseudogrignonense]|nr:hypothetical protein [Brucella pseudogrignonensis]NKX17023.1 hypothetical protein [Brucella pseudogrignonensis]
MPINATSMAVVKEARTGAITDYVVEWAGQPVHNRRQELPHLRTRPA